MNGHTLTLTPSVSTFKVGEEVALKFAFSHHEIPESYLGALGHVVILDDQAQTYLHVHPKSSHEMQFDTMFRKAGVYKMWAEFKLNGKVADYPFVIKVVN